MNGADTAWILTATALVLMMTLPGLALFYGGLVRSRNVLSVLMHCIAIACLMSVLWLVAGYSIAFGDGNAIWGGLGKAFLLGVGPDALSGTIPEVAFFAFQMTFAIITPALIVGAYVERIGFGFVLTFSALWMLIVYAPVAHWVWGGGWLAELGVMDFAGGIVVHETAGIAALVLAAMLGSRSAFGTRDLKPPHQPGMVMIGASLLWVGWFGFNGGSQLAADGGAAMAIVVTHISAAAASLSWAAYERIRHGKASMVGLVTGTIAGLASITPASGFVGPIGALIIGLVAGVLCQIACGWVKDLFKIDDTLDVFAVHGLGGIFGTIMAPILAAEALGGGGLSEGQGVVTQLIGLVSVGVFTVVMTVVLIMLVKLVFPLRVSADDEVEGLDYVHHGERAYDLTS
ncbi:ammonium transporter [Pontivivens insulae]|uniref:Ammonium transporter n=1 Tax=Pontivivens insulae TaxID=1639689 RepID=A0A2R8ADY7_9RHOB|nr:ammonium transporter [Pontivivens insulae]RED14213.1 ammonium transporter [Pontivivens insulae]SPF30288.1 Ammonia channel [Pontivivens insulae]